MPTPPPGRRWSETSASDWSPSTAGRGSPPASLGQALGCSRQAVHQWFGDQQALRLVFARVFASRWQRWSEVRLHRDGPTGLLPSSTESRAWTRVWLTLVEQATRDADLAGLAAQLRTAELEALTHHLERRVTATTDIRVSLLPHAVGAVAAAVDGLRAQVCRGLALEDASIVLDQLVDQLVASWRSRLA